MASQKTTTKQLNPKATREEVNPSAPPPTETTSFVVTLSDADNPRTSPKQRQVLTRGTTKASKAKRPTRSKPTATSSGASASSRDSRQARKPVRYQDTEDTITRKSKKRGRGKPSADPEKTGEDSPPLSKSRGHSVSSQDSNSGDSEETGRSDNDDESKSSDKASSKRSLPSGSDTDSAHHTPARKRPTVAAKAKAKRFPGTPISSPKTWSETELSTAAGFVLKIH